MRAQLLAQGLEFGLDETRLELRAAQLRVFPTMVDFQTVAEREDRPIVGQVDNVSPVKLLSAAGLNSLNRSPKKSP